ncbi:hypothetical protein PSACC_02369, partial [Paramicrosporidium saccamoebae]
MASNRTLLMKFLWLVLFGLCICSSLRKSNRRNKILQRSGNTERERLVVTDNESISTTSTTPTCDVLPAVAALAAPVLHNFNDPQSEIEAVVALSMLYELSNKDKANCHSLPGQMNQKNHGSRIRSSTAKVGPRTPPQPMTKSVLHQSPRSKEESAITNVSCPQVVEKSSPNRSGPSKEPTHRSAWFSKSSRAELHSFSQTTTPHKGLQACFSKRHFYGTMTIRIGASHMRASNNFVGCRVADDRILLLDRYKAGGGLPRSS